MQKIDRLRGTDSESQTGSVETFPDLFPRIIANLTAETKRITYSDHVMIPLLNLFLDC